MAKKTKSSNNNNDGEGSSQRKLTREQQHKKSQKQAAKQRQEQQEASGVASFTRQKTLKAINKKVEKVSTRFKYASFNQRLQDVHLAPAAITISAAYRPMSGLDNPISLKTEAAEKPILATTSVAEALSTWLELNQSIPFQTLYRQLYNITKSLPLLLHHRAKISETLTDCLSRHDQWRAWDAALDLLPRLANDLGSEFLPIYPEVLRAAIHVTTCSKAITQGDERAAALIVERGFQSSAWILKAVSPLLISKDGGMQVEGEEPQEVQVDERTERLVKTWDIIKPYLGWKEIQKRAQAKEVSSVENEQGDEETAAASDEEEAQPVQPKHSPRISIFTRRFASEGFAHLIRKTRGRQLANITAVMLQSLEEMISAEDKEERFVKHGAKRPSASFARGLAGVFAEGCKSVEKRLHSQATALLQALFSSDNQSQCAHSARLSVGRLAITSMVHHAYMTHFAPVVQLLCDLVEKKRVALGEVQEGEQGRRMVLSAIESIEWLATAAGVRKGTRVSEDVKGPLFALLLRLSPLMLSTQTSVREMANLRTSLVLLFALSIPIGRIQDLIGPGLKLVESLSPVTNGENRDSLWPEFSGLVEALADPAVNWNGFRQFALPSVLSATAATLSRPDGDTAVKDQALNLLERLNRLGQLEHLRVATATPSLTRWNNAVSSEILRRLETLIALLSSRIPTSKELEPLLPALELATLPQSSTSDKYPTVLINLIMDLLKSQALASAKSAEAIYEEQVINPTILLGAALNSLAVMEERNYKTNDLISGMLLQQGNVVAKIIETCSWHRNVLSGLARLAIAAKPKAKIQLPTLVEVAGSLERPIMAGDQMVRIAALELLSMIEGMEDSLFSKAVDVERTPLTVEHVRDRNVRMRAVGRELARLAGKSDETQVLLIIRYILGSCKINLKPIWGESIKALVEIVGSGNVQIAEKVFHTAFAEVEGGRLVGENERSSVPSSWQHTEEVDEETEEIPETEEEAEVVDNDKQFADPQLSMRRSAIRVCIGNARSSRGATEGAAAVSTTIATAISTQKPDARLDLLNYRSQILQLFQDIAPTVERYNAKFVDVFLRDAGPRNFAGVIVTPLDEDDGEEMPMQDSPEDITLKLGRRDRQAQLCAYLKVFAKVKNPKSLSRSNELHGYFMSLCSSPELTVQKLALDAILTWKDESIVPYVPRLRELLDTSRFRDTLTAFDVSADSQVIQEAHRPGLMPLIIRLLFGQMISRRGSKTTGSGQSARKSAILSAISDSKWEEFETLIELMLAPLGDQRPAFINGEFDLTEKTPVASLKRQYGFLSLLGDVLKYLGISVVPYWKQLVGVTLNLTFHSHIAVNSVTKTKTAEAEEGANVSITSATAPLRAVRQAGYKRISDFFRKPTTIKQFDWATFLPKMFESLISPRLASLRVESTQSPSALMELFHVWSSRPETVRLLAIYDAEVLPNIFAVFAAPSVKSFTVSRILDIVERSLAYGQTEKLKGPAAVPHMATSATVTTTSIQDLLIKPHVSTLLNCISPLVEKASGDGKGADSISAREELVKREIALLSAVAPFVTSSEDASHLVSLLHPMLKKGPHLVSEKTKADLLQIFRHLLVLTPEFRDIESGIFNKTFELFSGLFTSLRSREARLGLVEAFSQFSEVDSRLIRVCNYMAELDAYSSKRLGEPDFDRRLNAFDSINSPDIVIEAREWPPLVGSMLFFLQDHEELAIRSNATAVLKKFVTATAAEGKDAEYLEALFVNIVWPGLRRCLRSKHELVRREVLSVMSSSVEELQRIAILEDLQGLLIGGDQEANIFNNIHHIQVHRRLRAIRRLGEEAEKEVLKSKTIADILAPLLGNFLSKATMEHTDHNLMNEAILSLGKLARQMKWGAYNGLLWHYLKLAGQRNAEEKVYVRTATSILDVFHFAMEEKVDMSETLETAPVEDEEVIIAPKPKQQGASTVTIVEAVTNKLLPALYRYLEQKDETEDAVRLPVAVGVVRVVQCLPEQIKEVHISKLLRTLANVFKSKSQVTRDLAREALSRVMFALGQSYLPDLLRELRRALQRGPQLAVLAYSVHTLLVNWMAAEVDPIVSLSQGVKDIVEVSIEDIFGMTAEDRESIGTKTTFKEVRHSKSIDTFEQIAKVVVPSKMSEILQPLRDILQQTEVSKSVRQVEECLRRVSSGVSSNPQFDSDKFLILCATLIKRDAGFLQARKSSVAKKDSYNYPVLLKRKDVEASLGSGKDHYSRNAHKFVVFGLDLLSTALRRARFDFKDEQVLAKLNSLVEIVGETMYASEPAVLQVSLQTVAGIVRCPVSKAEKALPLFVKQILDIIKTSGSVQSDIVQTAFRTLSTILRDCKQSEIKEDQLVVLLRMIVPDLQETGVQATLFGLLRAIVSRRFIVAEVYDVMDKVAEMMVTNQSSQLRELCRTTYLQFLLDYPQGKERLQNQLCFLAKNLAYVHESGRLSVMDLISAIFDKFGDELLQEHADMFFVALSMVLANDESTKCREKGAGLIKQVVGAMSEKQRVKAVQMVTSWAKQDAKPELTKIGIQIYGLVLEVDAQEEWGESVLQIVAQVLCDCADDLEALEETEEDAFADQQLDWQLPYQALNALTKLQAADPNRLLSIGTSETAREATNAVRRLLLFPHKWVRVACSRLLGSLYGSIEACPPIMVPITEDPVRSFPALVDAAKKLSLQLKSPAVDEELGLQAVKNLIWIGTCFSLYHVEKEAEKEKEIEKVTQADDEEEEEETTQDDNLKIAADPMRWLFIKLSTQAKRAPLLRPSQMEDTTLSYWTVQPSSILRWLAAMSSSLPTWHLPSLLPIILPPVIRLQDETIPSPEMETLQSLAIEVQTLLQNLVGTSVFAASFSAIRQKIADKRKERKTQRLMLAIQDPEKEARKKSRGNQKKHESRKRKNERFSKGKLHKGERVKRVRTE